MNYFELMQQSAKTGKSIQQILDEAGKTLKEYLAGEDDNNDSTE